MSSDIFIDGVELQFIGLAKKSLGLFAETLWSADECPSVPTAVPLGGYSLSVAPSAGRQSRSPTAGGA